MKQIARRSRGTARIANRLLRRVRDYAEVMADGTATAPVADAALAQLDIDPLGLDQMDRELMGAMATRGSTAVRSASKRSLRRSPRSPTPSWMSTSRTC